jgi:hypothetical protein
MIIQFIMHIMHGITFSCHLSLTVQVECSPLQHFQSAATLWATLRVSSDGRLDILSCNSYI